MKKIKSVILLLICISFVLLLMSCGEAKGNSSGGSGAEIPEELENGDVSFYVWQEPSDEDKAFFKSFEQKYGGKVTVKVTTWGEMETKVLADIAVGDSPDLIWTYDANYIKNAINNVIAPIDGLIDLNGDQWDPISKKMTWKGKSYLAVPKGGTTEVIMYFNQTMFEINKLKTPLEYYNEGNWTFETFEQSARALTQDTNGDGTIDQYGWGSWRMFDFAYASGGAIVSKNETDDNVVNSLKDSKTMYGLQFLHDAYQTYKYAKPDGNVQFEKALPNGSVAMLSENYYIGSLLGDMKDKWDVVPFPVSPENKEKKNIVTPVGWGLAKNAKNPEGAVAYIKMWSEQRPDSMKKTIAKNFTEEQIERIFKAKENPFDPFIAENFGVWETSQWSFIFGIAGTEEVSKIVAEWEPILQGQIDKTIRQQD